MQVTARTLWHLAGQCCICVPANQIPGMENPKRANETVELTPEQAAKAIAEAVAALPAEEGGAKGPEPIRYGDWSHKGRCTDF